MLCAEGYVKRDQKSMTTATGYGTTFEVLSLTEKGLAAHKAGLMIRLQVPASIRQLEAAEQAAQVKRRKEMVDSGVDIDQVPPEERDQGDGPVTRAHLKWSRQLRSYRARGETDRADKMEQLLHQIQAWRDKKAADHGLAPASVLEEHVAKNVAYSRPASVEALREIGVRVTSIEELSQIISKFGPPPQQSQDRELARPIGLPESTWTPTKWEHAVYKVNKGKLPPWEISYGRFMKGEHPEAIAATQPSGKSVLTTTIFGHILDALTYGKPVDLGRLTQSMGPRYVPTVNDWEKIESAAAQLDLCIAKAEKFQAKEILAKILDEDVNTRGLTEKTPEQKTAEEQELTSVWYFKIRTWASLKRCRCPVECGEVPEAKRRRLAIPEPDTTGEAEEVWEEWREPWELHRE